MKSVRFHPEAKRELLSAVEYLQGIAPTFAVSFALEVESALERIRQFPSIGGRTLGAYRRWFVRRFHYELIYREAEGQIFVMAVAHERRAPGYWIGRTEKGDEIHEARAR